MLLLIMCVLLKGKKFRRPGKVNFKSSSLILKSLERVFFVCAQYTDLVTELYN